MSTDMPAEHSAGFVVVHRGADGDRYLLVNQVSHWSFPKGHIEEGETPIEAARRELFEETALSDISIIPGFEFKEEYVFKREGMPTHKTNVFFLAAVPSMTGLKPQDGEIAECGFFPEADALALLAFPESQKILLEAVAALRG